MNSGKTNALRVSVFAAGLAGFLGGASIPAQAQSQDVPDGWFKVCGQQEETNICNVQNIVVADNGQLVTGVSLIELEGKVNRRVFQVTVPSGRMVPPGVGLQIDAGQTRKIDYMICLPDRCIAEVQLSDELVNQLKRGSRLTLTSVNFQNQPNPINVTLSGFTAAFDGEPMEQSDIEERQRKLQDFVNENTEEFQRKLQEEQERAKQNNN